MNLSAASKPQFNQVHEEFTLDFGSSRDWYETVRDLERSLTEQNIRIDSTAHDLFEVMQPSKLRTQRLSIFTALDHFVGAARPSEVLNLTKRLPVLLAAAEVAPHFCMQHAQLLKVGQRCFVAMEPIIYGNEPHIFYLERFKNGLWIIAYSLATKEVCRQSDLWIFSKLTPH